MKQIILFSIAIISMTSCVSNKKYAALEAENARLKAQAPAQEARSEAEASMLNQKLDQIRELEFQIKAMEQNEKEFRMMMEAGKITPPTPEQMRVYELQHMEELNKSMAPGEDPMMREKSDMELEFERAAFENQMVVRAMQASLKDFSDKQITYDQTGGRIAVCIASKELFEEGKTQLSDIGKSLVGRLSVSLAGGNPIYYRIAGVTNKDNPGDLTQASTRAATVMAALKNEKGSVRLPQSIGASTCENATGPTSMDCDRIELIFEQDYESIMGRLEATIMN